MHGPLRSALPFSLERKDEVTWLSLPAIGNKPNARVALASTSPLFAFARRNTRRVERGRRFEARRRGAE
jgi:hypothetical protein